MTWLTVMEYLCHKWPWICSTCRKHFRSFSHSRLITGFVTRLTRRVPLVEQELPTLLEHLSSPPVFSGVRVTWSLLLFVCFVDRFLSFCTFSFGHCVVCPSSIYGFWLLLWYLQTLLIKSYIKIVERGKIYTLNTNTWPLTFLAWYRYFNKKWRGYI
jgi:hypothetical protein